jgi:hypothetical protein
VAGFSSPLSSLSKRSLSIIAIGGIMPKKKKKPIRKAKKKPARKTKKTRSKAPARKKKSVKRQSRTAGTYTMEVTEVDVITGIEEDDSIDESESLAVDPMDEHFPPDYGGSE